MKFIAILATFIITFVGSSCAISTEEKHGRKLGKKSSKFGKKSSKKARKNVGPKSYFSLINPAQESPLCAASNAALGNAFLTYNQTSLLCVKLTYSGLTGPELFSHIHGPAKIGDNAPVLYTFISSDPIKAECFTLTDEHAMFLNNGLLYFNIHSSSCPGGETRGQIFPM
jgi:hypothetical protein